MIRNDPATSDRERNVLRLRQQLLQRRLSGMSADIETPVPKIVHLIKTDPRTDDLPLLQYLCYRSILANYAMGIASYCTRRTCRAGPRWETLLPKLELQIALPPQHLASVQILCRSTSVRCAEIATAY